MVRKLFRERYWSHRFKQNPIFEIGTAFQPRRGGLAVYVSFYEMDRGIALVLGPLYVYLLLGAKAK